MPTIESITPESIDNVAIFSDRLISMRSRDMAIKLNPIINMAISFMSRPPMKNKKRAMTMGSSIPPSAAPSVDEESWHKNSV